MNTEIEAKFLDIDLGEMRKRLLDVGAVLAYPERLMKRKNFDHTDGRLQNIGGWVRVRHEGDKVTLTYKQLNDRTITGTKEVELVVDDFDTTKLFLESIGLIQTSYHETKREKWTIDDVEVTLDTWPWIPSFVEIEGSNEEDLRSIAAKLGLDWGKVLHGSVEVAYEAIYDVTEQEVDEWPVITFIDVPDWLNAKRRP